MSLLRWVGIDTWSSLLLLFIRHADQICRKGPELAKDSLPFHKSNTASTGVSLKASLHSGWWEALADHHLMQCGIACSPLKWSTSMCLFHSFKGSLCSVPHFLSSHPNFYRCHTDYRGWGKKGNDMRRRLSSKVTSHSLPKECSFALSKSNPPVWSSGHLFTIHHQESGWQCASDLPSWHVEPNSCHRTYADILTERLKDKMSQ